MPSLHTVERFVDLVEAGKGVDALDIFYAENATMQENQAQPRTGKAALMAHEVAAQAAAIDLRSRCIRPILIADDTVVIRWVFEYLDGERHPIRFEELACQRWVGDKIVQEQFFYDPGQFRPQDVAGSRS